MFQTFNIPQGVYDVVIDVQNFATNGSGRKKAGLFISKGGKSKLLIWMQVEIGQKIQTYLNRLIFYMPGETYSENYKDQRFVIENLTIDYEGETT